MKEEYLLDIINRMLDDTLEYIPEDEASMYFIKDNANKEAAKLSIICYIQPLKKLVDLYSSNTKRDKDIQKKIYSNLKSIAVNTGNVEILEYFADRLGQESDKTY